MRIVPLLVPSAKDCQRKPRAALSKDVSEKCGAYGLRLVRAASPALSCLA